MVTSADLAAGGGAAPRRRPRRAWRRPPVAGERLGVGGAGQQPGRGQQHLARVVGDLERRRGAVTRLPGRLEQHGAPRGAVGLGDLGQLVGDDLAQQLRRRSRIASSAVDRRAAARPAPSRARAGRTWSAGAAACRGCSRPGPRTGRRPSISRSLRLRGVVAGADQLDDLVDVEERDQQALDEVQPVRAPCARRYGDAAAYDVEAVVEVDLEQLLEARACAAGRRPARRC